MNNILDILVKQLPFICALVLGTIGRTIAGGVKHTEDFDWKKLLKGALKFSMILISILFGIVGIYSYEPLIAKFGNEVETLKIAICIVVFAEIIRLVREHYNVKDEDMKEAEKYNDGTGVSK
ncbi:MAG: hypothetical protein KBT03_03280 [Bacteroidales bacterium]|nr:hypothetical protein [Candidatus Scybalousia scybalohippi]